jgi:hypothetical protein
MSISQNFPEEGPTLNLNFAGSKTLDPRITFSRTTTGTYMDDSGLIVTAPADAPRFDHRYVNGEIESLGLLVEEERTNSLYYSNDFSQDPLPATAVQGWFKQNSHPVPTQSVVGPDGVSNSGWRFYRTNTNQYIYQQIVGAGTHTLSAWVRSSAATGSFTMQGYNATNGTMATLFTATNEWQRFSITISPTTTTGYYPCIPTSINTDFYVWGAQLELNKSFETSYIPTSGSTATRELDRAVIEGSNFTDIFNTNFEHFSMFVNYDNTDTDDGTNYNIISFWGESTNFDNRIGIFRNDASPYHIETRAFGGGSAIFSNGLLNASSKAATQKLATSWSVNYSTSSGAYRRWAFSFSGESVDVVNDNVGTTVPSLTRVGFGKNPTRADGFGGKIHFKQISLYSNTLTDSQLQTLTK